MKFKKAVLININKSSLSPDIWKKIEKNISKLVFLPKDSLKILTELKDADCLLVSFGLAVSKEMIDAAPNLKYIGILATAFGKVEIAHARKKKIIVSNLGGYSTESVAEFVIAAILDAIRGLEEGKKRARQNNFSELGIPAFEIKNKVFGVIGLGAIGGRVAEIALGFGANVVYYSKNRKKNLESKEIKFNSLDSLIENSDIISINLAQTKETENILNAKRINSLKTGAVVVNTAPMELVDIDALIKRLAKNDITFIFDHSYEMKEKDMKRLSKYTNCIIYPPIAYISREAAQNRQNTFLANIENFLKGRPTNIVN